MEMSNYKDLNIGFIGAGKVGFSLGKLFAIHGIKVTGYYSRHLESAREAAKFTGTEGFEDLEAIVNKSNALFLTVSDGEIASVFQRIKDFNISNKLICHTSGALSSKEVFEDIEENKAFGFSIHPLFPVSDKYESYRDLSDAFFCIEGSKEKLYIWDELFKELNIKTFSINSENKVKYHAACATASNLVCGIIKRSIDMLCECGFSEEDALLSLKPLIKANVDSILNKGPVNALTGPIERNDIETVKKHLKVIDKNEDINLYKSLSIKALECAEIKHPESDYKKLRTLLI